MTNLAEKYLEGGLINEVKRDFASLMKYEGVTCLGFRTYTPSFNDGDICEYTLEFLDKINHRVCDGEYILTIGEDDTLEVISTFDSYYDNWSLDSYPEPKYKTREWDRLVSAMAPLFLETNTEGLILLDGNSIIIRGEFYSYDL